MDNKYFNIRVLWNLKYRRDVVRLFSVLKYHGIKNNIYNILSKLISQYNLDDKSIVEYLYSLKPDSFIPPKISPTAVSREIKRAEEINDLILKSSIIIKKNFKYLDIGTGDGLIAVNVGKRIGISKGNVYGVDLPQWIGEEHNIKVSSDSINYTFIGEDCILPFEDNSFDVITVLQTLHHVKNLNVMMNEIRRVCKKGGHVIIREHNAFNKYICLLIDIEHLIYAVFNDGITIEQFFKNYYGNYFSVAIMNHMFAKLKLKQVFKTEKKNPTRHYFAVYKLQ